MPTYMYTCALHGVQEVVKPMAQSGDVEYCRECGKEMRRIFGSPPVHYNSDGFHHTDYGKGILPHAGNKADNVNKQWGKQWGESPPAPATDVPKSGKRE